MVQRNECNLAKCPDNDTPVVNTPAVKNTNPGSSINTTIQSSSFKSNEDPTHEAKENAGKNTMER